jgi:hypothetical protein
VERVGRGASCASACRPDWVGARADSSCACCLATPAGLCRPS